MDYSDKLAKLAYTRHRKKTNKIKKHNTENLKDEHKK
jgi:hypothetical protein